MKTEEVQKSIEKVIKIVDNQLPWKSIGIDAELSIDRNFQSGGAYQSADNPVGGDQKWVARKRSYPHPILDKSGKLRQSITSKPDNQSVDIISSGLEYNAAQNFGYAENNLPARPFMTIHPNDVEIIKDQIEEAITDAFES